MTSHLAPPWVRMLQAHADRAERDRAERDRAERAAQPEFADDYHATQNLDHAIRHVEEADRG